MMENDPRTEEQKRRDEEVRLFFEIKRTLRELPPPESRSDIDAGLSWDQKILANRADGFCVGWWQEHDPDCKRCAGDNSESFCEQREWISMGCMRCSFHITLLENDTDRGTLIDAFGFSRSYQMHSNWPPLGSLFYTIADERGCPHYVKYVRAADDYENRVKKDSLQNLVDLAYVVRELEERDS
jgi:hypothetical protein